MNKKWCATGYASDKTMNQREKKMRALNEGQVVGQLIADVLFFINKIELSIYKFLVSGTKNNKKRPHLVEFRFDRLTSRWVLNV